MDRRLQRRAERGPQDASQVLDPHLWQRHALRRDGTATRGRGPAALQPERAQLPRERRGGRHLQIPRAGAGAHRRTPAAPPARPPSLTATTQPHAATSLARPPQFSSSLLCKHPAFAADEKKESTQNIRCEPLGPDGKPIPAPTRVEKLAAAEKAAAAAAAAKKDADDTSADDTSADADADAAGADAPRRAPSSLAAQFAEPRPTELAFDLGQCLVHHRYNYRGTIVGYDRSCQQSEGWIRSMGVDALKYGRNQPFYHVLVDVRDRPGAQITYVAQENVMLDTPSVKLHLPMADDMFESFDVAEGRYVPKPELRQQYPLAERPAPRGSAGGE